MISSKNVNIESGNIEFNFENGNIDSKTGSNGAPRGVKRGHSIPYHHQQGAPPSPTPRGPRLTPFLLSMLNKSMLNSMLPFSMLSSCRCYSFDDNFFEVDVPVFDVSYFSQKNYRKKFVITDFCLFFTGNTFYRNLFFCNYRKFSEK